MPIFCFSQATPWGESSRQRLRGWSSRSPWSACRLVVGPVINPEWEAVWSDARVWLTLIWMFTPSCSPHPTCQCRHWSNIQFPSQPTKKRTIAQPCRLMNDFRSVAHLCIGPLVSDARGASDAARGSPGAGGASPATSARLLPKDLCWCCQPPEHRRRAQD